MEIWGPEVMDWAEKYRPRRLEDMILPVALKQRLIAIRDKQLGPSMLFYGQPGTGKTTAAVLLSPLRPTVLLDCEKFGTEYDVNGMLFRLRKHKDEKIVQRVIAMDAADRLSKLDQQEIPRIMDLLSTNSMFVFTTDSPSSLIDRVHSRLLGIDFDEMRGDQVLIAAMTERAMKILEFEEVSANPTVVRGIVSRWFPDMRKVLKQLQFEVGLVA